MQNSFNRIEDGTRSVFEVHDGNATAYVWATSNEDAQHTCYVHDYLDDDSDGDWEIAVVPERDHDYAERRAEADRRFDALHGRVTA